MALVLTTRCFERPEYRGGAKKGGGREVPRCNVMHDHSTRLEERAARSDVMLNRARGSTYIDEGSWSQEGGGDYWLFQYLVERSFLRA